MEALLYFAVWAGLFFLMMRFGCGAHVMGHNRAHRSHSGESDMSRFRWIPPETDQDPVCGKTIATAGAKSSVHAGTVFYFCSNSCRDRFEAEPDAYLKTDRSFEEPSNQGTTVEDRNV
jgi:YHS domain-containing protein